MLSMKRKPEQSGVDVGEALDGFTKRQRNLEQKPNNLEELHNIVTVEISFCDERGINLIRNSEINMLSHCVFCLRKTTTSCHSSVSPPPSSVNLEDVSSSELVEDVPRAHLLESSSSLQLLSTFNIIWNYLKSRKKGGEVNNENPLHLLEESQALSTSGKARTTFLDLPRLCVLCADKIKTIQRLFTELRTQLDVIEGILKDSKYCGRHSWRAEHFEKKLAISNLEQGVKNATLNILDKLGKIENSSINEQRYDGVEDYISGNSELAPIIAPEERTTENMPRSLQGNESSVSEEENGEPKLAQLPKSKEDSCVAQLGPSSTYVKAPGADNDFHDNFVDEDDDWKANESDPDYIKSEPEDDFSEEESSSYDDDSAEEKPPPRTRDRTRTTIFPDDHGDAAIRVSTSIAKLEKRKYTKTGKFKGLMKTKPKLWQQMCDLCDKILSTADMYAHVREHVGEEYMIPCPSPKCDKVFAKFPSLYVHLKGRGQSKQCRKSISNIEEMLEIAIKCQECGHKAADRTALRAHLLNVHENDTKKFSCPMEKCLQQFTVKQSVQCHIEHHSMFQKCAQCNTAIKFEGMQSHLKEVHGVEAEKLIKCNHCQFVCSSREDLVNHLHEHRSSVLSCDICGDKLEFSTYYELREHYGKVHNVGERFPCEHCQYVGWTRIGLRLHLNRHSESNKNKPKTKLQRLVDSGQLLVTKNSETGDEQFSCKIDGCEENFQSYKIFYEHQMKMHQNEPGRHQCDQCDKCFVSPRGLQNHKLEKHIRKLVKGKQMCDLCRKILPLKDIREHVREHVSDEYLIACPNSKCAHAFTKQYSLYIHLLKKKRCSGTLSNIEEILDKAKRLKCQECGHEATESRTLRAHLLREHENSTKNFSCPIKNCLQKFTVKQSVKCHIDVHKAKRPKRASEPPSIQKCAQCESTFQFEEMENHLKETHGAEEFIKCSHCPFVFSTRDREHFVDHLFEHRHSVLSCDICGDHVKFSRYARLPEHYFNVHNVGKRFPCEHCNYTTYTTFAWKEHMSNNHMAGKKANADLLISVPKQQTKRSYKCDTCDASFCRLAHLQDHKINEHGAEPYCCKICSATFLLRQHLLKHEKEHAGPAAMFRCEVEGCGKSYAHNCYLKKHIATAHRGERPHICESCGKSYKCSSGLRMHKNTVHSGLRHVCDTCGESFTTGTNLRRHQRIHTGERPFGCEICGQRFRHRNVLKTHVEAHRNKGTDFKPNGPMKQIRKRVEKKSSQFH